LVELPDGQLCSITQAKVHTLCIYKSGDSAEDKVIKHEHVLVLKTQ
jgi:hypothetical protein